MAASYELDCTDCEFRTTVGGEFEAVLDEIESHQRAQQAGPTEHFVNIHRRE